MANGDGGTNGAKGPWWAELIRTFGPTASIAAFLVWMMAGQVIPMLQQMAVFMQSHTQQMADLMKEEQDDAAQRARQWSAISELEKNEHHDREAALALGQQTCINVAKSPYQVSKCQEVRDAGEAQ